MRFGIQSGFLLTTACALLFVFIKTPWLAVLTMVFLLPAGVVAIGLTAPQKGTKLDVATYRPFVQMFRLWVMLVVGLALCATFLLLFPDAHRRIKRWRVGDLRSHQIGAYVTLPVGQKLPSEHSLMQIRDRKGLVGETRYWRRDYSANAGTYLMVISTDRREYTSGTWYDVRADVQDGTTLLFRELESSNEQRPIR